MKVEFVIREWAAWAPGHDHPEAWLAWLAAPPALPGGPADAVAPVAGMAPMLRRRLNPLGRMAAEVTYAVAGSGAPVPAAGSHPGCPVVFASRYGEAERSLALLAQAVRGEPLSPTAFGLSVHNAVGAMISIARADRAHHTALAGGPATAALALVEAAGLLADGAPEVLVVCYDAPLPGEYAGFMDEAAVRHAWAWRVALPQRPDQPRLSLSLVDAEAVPEAVSEADGAAPPDDPLPFSLSLLRFGLGTARAWRRRAGDQAWLGERHG